MNLAFVLVFCVFVIFVGAKPQYQFYPCSGGNCNQQLCHGYGCNQQLCQGMGCQQPIACGGGGCSSHGCHTNCNYGSGCSDYGNICQAFPSLCQGVGGGGLGGGEPYAQYGYAANPSSYNAQMYPLASYSYEGLADYFSKMAAAFNQTSQATPKPH